MFKRKNNKFFLTVISIFLMVGLMGSNVVGAKIANVPATQHEARIQKQNAHEHKKKVQKQASKRDSHVQAKKNVKKHKNTTLFLEIGRENH